MSVRQISIFVENKPGRLARITKVLADNDINIRALCVADTADFGILRLIVTDTDKAVGALRECGASVSVAEVLAVNMNDKPGALNTAAEALAAKGISVEYVYAFTTPNIGEAFLIMRVDDNEAAKKALTDAGMQVEDEIEGL
jgi:hypothetical protein